MAVACVLVAGGLEEACSTPPWTTKVEETGPSRQIELR
jgi:hypothetical protein